MAHPCGRRWGRGQAGALHHVAGTQYTTVGSSSAETLTASSLNTFPTRITAQAGDGIGLIIFTGSHKCTIAATGDPGDVANISGAANDTGTTATYNPPSPGGTRANVSAVVEPDTDNDGFGDETQDGCPTDAITQGGCPVPDTTITKRPKDKTKKKTATFGFTSSIPGSTFECKLDDGAFQPCSSPHTLKVGKGKHHFEVRATSKGETDGSPATDDWKVKKKKKR